MWVKASQLDLPSLMRGRLHPGVAHWATSVGLLQVFDDYIINNTNVVVYSPLMAPGQRRLYFYTLFLLI